MNPYLYNATASEEILNKERQVLTSVQTRSRSAQRWKLLLRVKMDTSNDGRELHGEVFLRRG